MDDTAMAGVRGVDQDDPAEARRKAVDLEKSRQGITAWRPLDAARFSAEQREAAYALIDMGDLSFLLHPGQEKMREFRLRQHMAGHMTCVFNVARQSGKSWMFVIESFEYLLTHPHETVWYLAPFGVQVKAITRLSIEKIITFFHDGQKPKKSGTTYRFPNGAIFDLKGVVSGTGSSIRGSPASRVVIDEAGYIPNLSEVIKGSVVPMFQTTNGWLDLVSTPPASTMHPFSSIYIPRAQVDGCYYHSTYLDNPMRRASDELLRQTYPLMDADPEFRREYLADHTVSDTRRRVCKSWDAVANDHWLAAHATDKPFRYDAYVGFDPGFSTDALGLVFGYFDWRYGVLVIEAEFSALNLATQEVAAVVVETERRLGYRNTEVVPRIIRTSDVSLQMICDMQSTYGLQFAPKPYHGMLKPQRVAMFDDDIRIGRIRVTAACPQLRTQLESGIWDDNGKNYVRSEVMGHLDLLDACDYCSESVSWTSTYKGNEVTALDGANSFRLPYGKLTSGGRGRSALHRALGR